MCPYRSLILSVLALSSCGGSSGGIGPPDPIADFEVVRTTPANEGRVFLNDPLKIDFSGVIDPRSVNFGSVSFAVFDLQGNQLTEDVAGSFRISRATGDTAPGRRLEFWPRFPKQDDLADGGFRAGRRYIMQLIKGDPRTGVGLRSTEGLVLENSLALSFETVSGSTAAELFRDTVRGGPVRSGFLASPRSIATGRVELNELGQVGVEVRLTFDQSLSPHSQNIPTRIDLDPRRRGTDTRGGIFLEYDDPTGQNTWIPARVDLARNDPLGAEVILRPLGILPNNSEIRVIVEPFIADISGESNENRAGYERVFGRFQTDAGYQLRFDALVERFEDAGNFDLQAPFVEPLAAVLPGSVRANFGFEGGASVLDYEPSSAEVVLDTDFTSVSPKNGRPINVSGGVFQFRSVRIPRGVTVKGTGSKPMVWLVNEDFVVEGSLLVEGGGGQRVNTLNSANSPAGGGVANCGGGNGGQGSPRTADRSLRGQAGFGPGQVPNGGGQGGRLSCYASCRIGSGGGGGSFATQGDPFYKVPATNRFEQPLGIGGWGCNNRNSTFLPGGAAGSRAFTDQEANNDFWGSLVDLHGRTRIAGELEKPQGGQGGGGGGDYSVECGSNPSGFVRDQKGGGGGAGGGVLIIKALGSIEIAESGLISADGGDGGGGAWAGSNNRAGGGGGGSGGMVVLMAGQEIRIHAHGETYELQDYRFAITADGGVGLRTPYGAGTVISSKYIPAPHAVSSVDLNQAPTGGFGGFGVVQLMAPPGDNRDGTNTVLDDSIHVYIKGSRAGAADKMRYLGWRGIPDQHGVYRDDAGKKVDLGEGEGDIRPAPILMAAPFGRVSRLRSRWLDLGAAARRVTGPGGDGLPRGIEAQGGVSIGSQFGPLPEFAGLISGDPNSSTDPQPNAGFIRTRTSSSGAGVEIEHPVIFSGIAVASVQTDQSFRGGRAMVVELSQSHAGLATLEDRYSHYQARIREGALDLGSYRILGHSGRVLYLSSESGSLPDIPAASARSIRVDVVAQFFGLYESGVPGFQQTRLVAGNGRLPRANLRIGFAFHRDPADAEDLSKRFPQLSHPGAAPTFFYDWANPVALEALRAGGFRFVQYDLVFDSVYEPVGFDPNPHSYGADAPLPELQYLVLPYRY